MRPALSIIFFTTLSGAGYGLLAWTGIAIALLALRGGLSTALDGVQFAGVVLGLVLSTAGLLSSLGHLGQPRRAWRALSQWRTSWLSREGVLAIATAVTALAVIALLVWMPAGASRAAWLALLGLLLAVQALATVACTAMIYASLKPIPAWRHPLVVPVYLLFALLTGLALQFLVMAAMLRGQGPAMMLASLAILGALLAGLKWLYWLAIDGAGAPAARGAALGLPGRDARVFEHPHTEANYITREMVFAVARRHALRLRIATSLALVAAPLLATLLVATALLSPVAGVLLAALGLLAAAFVERWLFFAQARHVVSAYY
ncbi:DmsC/YnfH family molybdoenzyme membrane anchor subunit [Luteimonas sp. MC1825]|uniref:dimethyl sulfoxide reductase anchor subunit family protein n=1 Tax=Luteimonas sp. MC1825 TaxID=2761107 RepID=UPI00160DFD9E|nr:DmsC/YnfH family molybdoenzyme membrane anchor subunit [Luteimonas sp. MC1825]MBB6600260.1 dimethyl sulfoxide reductase anchor subunit [Luteimonas sp. MC1825]QOC87943.1 dimethyl sulfoxide reductase anchor subunit [Luteimonas sp. MC1825]